jgi:crotonobetainyl-CoA:carnitine CoA-transferase CaiB-like acyl-CoA transferase
VGWERLAEAVEMPELVTDERFQTSGERYDHADEVDAALRPWLLDHTSAEVAAILQEHRVPAAEVTDVVRVLGDEQLRARRFFQPIVVGGATLEMPGSPLHVGPAVSWTAAPRLGADSDRVLAEGGTHRTGEAR